MKNCQPRNGFLMFAALVCIALTVALVGLIARMMVVDMQYDRARLRNMQCQWLVEAGVQRAAARLAADPGFAGETWHVGPEHLDGRHAGVVRIAVVAPTEEPAERTIHIQADYPDDPHLRVRHTRIVRLLDHTNQAYQKEEP